jgi:hypothetical protein
MAKIDRSCIITSSMPKLKPDIFDKHRQDNFQYSYLCRLVFGDNVEKNHQQH